MEEQKVSIIIPVFNTEKYITRCIKSIFSQTYTNLEIICINDGSTDRSGQMLAELKKADRRLKVINQDKQGAVMARNRGLAIATGELIGFVDSDDYIKPDMIEKMVRKITDTGADVVACGFFYDNNGKISKACNLKEVPTTPMLIEDFMPYIWERDTYKGVASYLWTRLIRRKVIKDEDGGLLIEFSKDCEGGAEDVIFIAEMNLRIQTIVYIDEPLYYYYQREGSVSHDEARQLNTMFLVKAYEKLLEMYDESVIQKKVLILIKRKYVYHLGKTLEIAFEYGDKDNIILLKEKIRENLLAYVEGNLDHIERIEWIVSLLMRTEL